MQQEDGRHPQTGLAAKVRRVLRRFVKARDVVDLSVAGDAGTDLTAMRISVRLRKGARAPDGRGVLALVRRLRAVLGLAPGAGLPVLMISLVEGDPAKPGRTGADSPGGKQRPPMPEAGHRGTKGVLSQWAELAIRGDWRRSRAPPSPWCRRLDACG